MEKLDEIDLQDGRSGTVVYVSSDHAMIIVKVGPELIDYEIGENSLMELSRMTLGPEDLANRLIEGTKWAADADIQR
ncbi:hypothetical protein BB934_07430 [Microvirga ossetica]|uniref:Uncharacterized protein n=1 Tax=Microvirga ossetica TaxID=1882682 RepID=A0A1B2EDL3_9HYPH|nr:hypothetical protein [Microvirga ossetica]ANY78086.1 hypothetical protein BB934_07430 [Microvirga ossetica]